MSHTESSNRSSNSGQYALCIEGLPTSYTWQDVKDLARNRAEHGIRAEVASRVGANGEKITVHVASVARWAEANNLYDWLISTRIEHRQLRVHFFEGATCIKSNCHISPSPCLFCRAKQTVNQPAPYYPASPQAPHTINTWAAPAVSGANGLYASSANPPSSADRAFSHQTSQGLYTTLAAPLQTISAPASAGSIDPRQIESALIAHVQSGNELTDTQEEFLRRMQAMQIRPTPPPYNYGINNALTANSGPILAAAASGAPINTAYGYARTEVRGVFVSGLDFKTKSQEVVDLFSKAGTVRKCQLHADGRGHGKGTATIEFATAAQAVEAINTLNNFVWKRRTLKVRSDREAVVIRAPTTDSSSNTMHRQAAESDIDREPTIVDGSNNRQTRRDSKIVLS